MLADMLTDELIARRPSGRTGLASWYAEVLQAQDAEGIRASDLAALLGVTTTNIYYWRRRLRDLDAGEESARAAAGPSGLIRVDVARDPEGPTGDERRAALEVRLTDSRTIVVPSGFDADELRKLVSVLEAC